MSPTYKRVKQSPPEPPSFIKNFIPPEYFNEPQFADAKLVFGSRCIHVHRYVLVKSSQYFYRAFSGKFIEAQEKTIRLPEHQYELYCLLVALLYDGPSTSKGKENMLNLNLENSFEFLAAADYIQAPAIKDAVVDRIIGFIHEAGKDQSVKDICQSARLMMQLSDACRTKIQQCIVYQFKYWFGTPHFHLQAVEALLLENPKLALDILRCSEEDAADGIENYGWVD